MTLPGVTAGKRIELQKRDDRDTEATADFFSPTAASSTVGFKPQGCFLPHVTSSIWKTPQLRVPAYYCSSFLQSLAILAKPVPLFLLTWDPEGW